MVSWVLTMVAAVAAASLVEQASEKTDDFLRIHFDIHRGDNVLNMAPERRARLVKRDDFTMEVENAQTFYLTELVMGSEKEKTQVLVDTGSSDLWVMSHDVRCFSVSGSTSKSRIYVGDVKPQLGGPKTGSNVTASKSTPVKEEEELIAGQGKGFGDDILSAFGIGGTDEPLGPDGGGSGSGFGSGSDGDSTNTCTSYGSFSTGDSDTFKRNSSAPAFLIEYADGTTAEGFWGHDTVRIHNATVKDLSFAVANETSSNIGVLGIGLPGLETTFSSGNLNNYQYENLPMKLKAQGIINKLVYSLYLGHDTHETGTILFGAVDHAKYSGTLRSLPIVNSHLSSFDEPLRLEINLTGLKLSGSGRNSTITDNGYAALLDTGSTLSYLPQALLERMADVLGLSYSSSLGGYIMDCDVDDSTEVIFDFSGVTIKAPLSDFPIRASRSTCIFGILPQSSTSNYVLLGDNFLRNAYVVYDLDDLTISLAQVNYTDDEDIDVISSSIPSAEAVSSAATTALTGGPVPSSDDHINMNGDDSDEGDGGSDAGFSIQPSVVFTLVCAAISMVLI